MSHSPRKATADADRRDALHAWLLNRAAPAAVIDIWRWNHKSDAINRHDLKVLREQGRVFRIDDNRGTNGARLYVATASFVENVGAPA